MFTSQLKFRNSHPIPHVVYVEPWAEDFTLFPGEALEVHAYSLGTTPHFYIVASAGITQVYCESSDTFKVIQDGAELACGHRRQAVA